MAGGSSGLARNQITRTFLSAFGSTDVRHRGHLKLAFADRHIGGKDAIRNPRPQFRARRERSSFLPLPRSRGRLSLRSWKPGPEASSRRIISQLRLAEPTIPVISNVEGCHYQAGQAVAACSPGRSPRRAVGDGRRCSTACGDPIRVQGKTRGREPRCGALLGRSSNRAPIDGTLSSGTGQQGAGSLLPPHHALRARGEGGEISRLRSVFRHAL